ncbi:MAG: hypothetical protein IKZ54_01785 [Bacteroidales bacterium]|nr:hypothetical protein [Bacteroidales bacterium]
MPILKFKNGEWCEMTPEEIQQEKEMVAQKSQVDEKTRQERQQELYKQYGAEVWNASKGENCMEVIYEFFDTPIEPQTLCIDISDGLITCTWEDYSNNAYKRIDLLYIDTLAVRRLLNCENNAALFEEMKNRFGSEDGIELIDSWLTENGLYFKREEE